MKDRRGHFRLGLHAVYLPYYDGLCGVLGEDWQPISGVRTFKEQSDIFEQGRTTAGEIITQARPGLSFHNYGVASDWGYFPNGIYTPISRDDRRWQEYVDACEKVGLRCLKWEKPHNEIDLPVSIQTVFEVYTQKGFDGVDALLRKVMNHGSISS